MRIIRIRLGNFKKRNRDLFDASRGSGNLGFQGSGGIGDMSEAPVFMFTSDVIGTTTSTRGSLSFRNLPTIKLGLKTFTPPFPQLRKRLNFKQHQRIHRQRRRYW